MHRSKISTPESALAAEMFNHFCSAGTMKQILTIHRSICEQLTLKPTRLPDYYPKLKDKLANSWKAQALFKKFDARANHKVYAKGTACANLRVLIIGAGPCGLRAAIECQLLGAKVVVLEKRDRMSRNNVLHLWPFVIHDLRALGAKKFYGKFCAGSIDHISIRQLQCILLKVCLLLGVEFHEGVSFEQLLEPTVAESGERLGWRARVTPAEHPVSQLEFDALLGADGKRNTLREFQRKEFRGKLAIAITANFINRHTEQEASVEEISGVAFIFKQKFFKDLLAETGIDLENIVYYKDETHYFVMTAKKQSLLEKGVLIEDHPETNQLLRPENVEREALKRYALEAARYSTEGLLPRLDFALNARGEEDVTLFDFTSMTSALNASMVYERSGRRLLMCLVGDSLLEPFWPTGSGCARGFLSALDAAWAVRAWGATPPPHPVAVIMERESIYRLLGQTTPENLNRDYGGYTLDPRTRYPNLNRSSVTAHKVAHFYNSDDPLPIDASASMRKRRRETQVGQETLVAWVKRVTGREPSGLEEALAPVTVAALVRSYRPDLLPLAASDSAVYNVLLDEFDIPPMGPTRATLRGEVSEGRMRSYLRALYRAFKGEVPHMHHATDTLADMAKPEKCSSPSEQGMSERARRYRKRCLRATQECGRGAGAAGARGELGGGTVARLAAELASGGKPAAAARARKPDDLLRAVGRIEQGDWNVREIERQIHENQLGRPRPRLAERVPKWDREQFLERQNRVAGGAAEEDERYGELDQTIRRLEQKKRDSGRPAHGTKKVASLADRFAMKATLEPEKPANTPQGKTWTASAAATVATKAARCAVCGTRVFAAEAVTADGLTLHKACFRCVVCRAALRPGCYSISQSGNRLTCLRHGTATVPDGATVVVNTVVAEIPERFRDEDEPAREMDEDEWTDRNFLASETSGAGGLSDEEESSSDEYTEAAGSGEEDGEDGAEAAAEREAARGDGAGGTAGAPAELIYLSDDSYGYDHSSEDCASSSESECGSRREARRREVPRGHDAPPATDSSEAESEESESTDIATSSATEVSTDSEFDEEEAAPPKIPPAITVTAPPALLAAPAPPPPAAPPSRPRPAPDYALSRTRSAGGLATKRALELKRLYLLGEPSPAPVRRSDSASHIDLNNINRNISEIQKLQLLLHPAAPATVQEQIRPTKLNLIETYVEKPQLPVTNIQVTDSEPPKVIFDISKTPTQEVQLDTDSLSDDSSSITKTGPNPPPPRLEVHNASGELVQLDSLMIVAAPSVEEEKKEDEQIKSLETLAQVTVPKPESESSESCRDATLALTETELSDWTADHGVLDDLEDKSESIQTRRFSVRNPRVLGAPKNLHETTDVTALSAHVCGRTVDEVPIIYSNATEHFEFADEGDDVSVNILPPRNAGYFEFVDDDDDYREDDNMVRDRSINFIERPSSTFVDYPSLDPEVESQPVETEVEPQKDSDETASPVVIDSETPTITELSSTFLNNGNLSLSKSSFTNLTEMSSSKAWTTESEESSPPLTVDAPTLSKPGPISFSVPLTFMVRPSIPYEQIPEETPQHHIEPLTPPVTPDNLPLYCLGKSASVSVVPSSKVEEIKRERENQTEVVRRLVLERMGGAPPAGRKSSRRTRLSPGSGDMRAPPPVPPPPQIPPPPARPPPPLRLMPSMSDPELTRVRRRRGIIQTVSDFFNRRVSSRKKWLSVPERFNVSKDGDCGCDESVGGAVFRACSSRPPPELRRRRASHAPARSPPAVSQLVLSPTHLDSYACCPLYHRPAGGPPLPMKIWSSE